MFVSGPCLFFYVFLEKNHKKNQIFQSPKMLTCGVWVKKGVAKEIPDKVSNSCFVLSLNISCITNKCIRKLSIY